jgi:hypothetical protein
METLDEIKKNVEHPAHYGGADNPYEAIKVLREWQLDEDAYLWNVGKYLSRAGHKDGNSPLQDLMKARYYLDYKIRLLEEQQKVAESVVDTLKKIPDEANDKLTTMPDYIPRHAKPDYTDDLVFRPEIHAPNIETAVVPSVHNDTMSPNNKGVNKVDHSMLNSKVYADEVKF